MPQSNPFQLAAGFKPIADANATIDHTVSQAAYTSITAARTVTMAPSSTFDNGQLIDVGDTSGSCSGTNTITIQPTGSDLLNGAASTVISVPYGMRRLRAVPGGFTFDVASSFSFPSSTVTQFGSGTATFPEEGNIARQVPGVTGQVQPGATGADNVVAVYSIPANSFDVAGRGVTVTAEGVFAANVNTKRCKLWFNPSAAVVGSTITGGTLMADTGAVTTNGGSWWLGGNAFKRGAAGSNTQTVTSNGAIAGSTHTGISAAADTTATESGAILVAVTINATTATTDAGLVWFEVNAMN